MSTQPAQMPDFRSKTKYTVAPEDEDAIIRTVTLHRTDYRSDYPYDCRVIWFPDDAHNRVSSISVEPRKPNACLGELDSLPLELIQQVCLQLDMASLFRFRQTNARAREILHSIHEYRSVVKHALDQFCALLRTEAASHISLSDFYALLCTENCSVCHIHYGNLLYLPTLTRCCQVCLRRQRPEIRTVSLSYAKRNLKLGKGSLEKLSKIKTHRTPESTTKQTMRQYTLVSNQAAIAAYREKFPDQEPPAKQVSSVVDQFAFMACCSMPSYSIQSGRLDKGVRCAGCVLGCDNACENTTPKHPWCCSTERVEHSRAGFLEHFAWCEHAQKVWMSSKRGTKFPDYYPRRRYRW